MKLEETGGNTLVANERHHTSQYWYWLSWSVRKYMETRLISRYQKIKIIRS